MRDPDRIGNVLIELGVYWSRHPDLRLAQIIGNVTGSTDPYYFEDDELLTRLTDLNKTED